MKATTKTLGAFLATFLFVGILQSAEMTANPYARIYLDYHYQVPQNGDANGSEWEYPPQFELERAYFGLKGKGDFLMLGKAKVDLTLDVRSGVDLGKIYWVPYLKKAVLEWQFIDMASMAFGLQGTQLWGVQERLMGYRSVMKTYMDRNGFYSGADLGTTLNLTFMENMLTMNAFFFNGDGYNQKQLKETINMGANATVSTKDFLSFGEVILYGVAQFGMNLDDDFRPGERAKAEEAANDPSLLTYPNYEVVGLRPIYAGMLGFRNDVLRGYVEFAHQKNYKWYAFTNGDDSYDFNAMGLSIFGAWGVPVEGLLERFGLYARIDLNMSDVYEGEDDGVKIDDGGGISSRTAGDAGLTTFWAGIELTFDKAFQTVISYKLETRDAYAFEKNDENKKDGVADAALLVDMQLQF